MVDVSNVVLDETYEEPAAAVDQDAPEPAENVKALVRKIQASIRADKGFHKKAFEKMRRDMHIAKYGADKDYPTEHYKANIAGRHVRRKTDSLYAKNPKVVARRRDTLDFAVWDENPDSLKLALTTIQQMQAAFTAPPPAVDPMTGATVAVPGPIPPPEMQHGFEQAQAVLQDFQQGIARRLYVKKIGRTLEILYDYAMHEQQPVDGKRGFKQMVRRACTTAVGYCKIGFERQMGARPGLTDHLSDARTRLDHLERLSKEMMDGEMVEDDAEMAELRASIAQLQAEPEIVLREGLVFDFPASTRVIPDQDCTKLEGFIGARHLTIEYIYTPDEVQEVFGVDLKKKYTGYGPNGKLDGEGLTLSAANSVPDDDDELGKSDDKPGEDGRGKVCVWEYFDKPSGLVYYVADGHDGWLREPAAPDVFVEGFWPVFALTFNDVENEQELFPPSDVSLIYDMQMEYNRSRQGMREHRSAARPRWVGAKGALDEDDINLLKTLNPFEIAFLNKDPQSKITDLLEAIPVPGVDPNLYETNQLFTDIQFVVGSSEAQFGGTAQATATESAIAANSSTSSDSSSIDDLDAFLTAIARSSGQIMLREMSEEQVKAIVGVGAVWPELSLTEIAKEMFLEVEAGSTGRPNQAVEIANMKELLPFLIQMPGIPPDWLAKQVLRRMDDKIDLTEAYAAGIPSIVMQNQMKQPGTGDPATDPSQQGQSGGDNGPQPPQQGGSGPAFGSNQV